MYVVRHMSAPPVTMPPEASIAAVQEVLQSHHFRHLPIVDDAGRLVGIVTDRDVRSAYPSSVLDPADREAALARLAETPVRSIMTADPASLSSDATLDDTLYLFDRRKVGALPVVDAERRVIGMFSIRDLVQAYNKLYGLGERGSALVVVEDDGQPRILSRIVQALEEREILFSRLVRTAVAAKAGGTGAVYLRVHTFNVHGVYDTLRSAGLRIASSGPADPARGEASNEGDKHAGR